MFFSISRLSGRRGREEYVERTVARSSCLPSGAHTQRRIRFSDKTCLFFSFIAFIRHNVVHVRRQTNLGSGRATRFLTPGRQKGTNINKSAVRFIVVSPPPLSSTRADIDLRETITHSAPECQNRVPALWAKNNYYYRTDRTQ